MSKLKRAIVVVGMTIFFALAQIAVQGPYRNAYWSDRCDPGGLCSQMPVFSNMSETDYYIRLVFSSLIIGLVLTLMLIGVFMAVRHLLPQGRSR